LSKPRLLVVGPTPPPVHGVTVYLRWLLDASALRERWEVLHADTSDRRSLANLGRVDPPNVALALRHVWKVAARVRRERVRAVWIPVSQNGPAYLRDALFILAAHAGGARVVTHLHGGGFGEFYHRAAAPLRGLVRASSARVERAWVLGEGLRANYAGLIPEERVRVVPNGVPDPLPPGPRPSPGFAPTLLHLGQLSVEKGVVDLLSAVARLREAGRELRLVLAGGWSTPAEEMAVRGVIRDLGLGAVVELPGVLTGAAKARVLGEADAFVLATRYRYEGQPLAILEAMAAGLPVVATPRAAIPDAVEDGVTGLLVPERDVPALTDALARLLGDAELRRRLGAAGRDRWQRRFTLERAMARVVEALEEVRGDAPVLASVPGGRA
jgi:glycosyltransferase involved in cell wall biosynthesis